MASRTPRVPPYIYIYIYISFPSALHSSLHLIVVTPRSGLDHRAFITPTLVVTPRTRVDSGTNGATLVGRLRSFQQCGASHQILSDNLAMLAGSLTDPTKQRLSDNTAMLAGSLADPTKQYYDKPGVAFYRVRLGTLFHLHATLH